MYREALKSAVQMVFAPQIAWEYVSMRRESNLYTGFLIPLWSIIILASFIGGWFVVGNAGIETGLKSVIVSIFTLFVGFQVASFLLNEYVSTFTNDERELKKAQVFVAYSSSLLYIIDIFVSILPDFFFLWLFTVYTFYIVYTGSEIYYQMPAGKRTGFMVVASLLVLVTPLLIRYILSMMIRS